MTVRQLLHSLLDMIGSDEVDINADIIMSDGEPVVYVGTDALAGDGAKYRLVVSDRPQRRKQCKRK